MAKLRKLKFENFDQIIEDINQLRNSEYDQGGNWNLSQVCEHLSNTILLGIEGGKPAPWFLRRVMFPVLFRVLIFMGSMPSGATAPPEIVPPEREADDPESIDNCLRLLAIARDRQEKLPPNPIVAGMSLSNWKKLQLIHSAHHLAFISAK